MPNTYSFFGSATYSVTKDNLDELMSILPNNNSNLIDPQDLRDSVFTLWDKVEAINASFSGTVSTDYNRTTLSTAAAVGGVSTGSTFSGTIQDALDRIFYPYVPVAVSLSGGNTREFGSLNTLTLSWSVTKNSQTIFSITVDGVPIPGGPWNTNQSGIQGATATQNVNTSFYMDAMDTPQGSNPSTSTTVYWSNRRYWGTHTTFTALNSAQILALTGAGIPSGSELSSTRVQTRNGINGAGDYLVFAWPTTFGTPTFVINGLPNSAWTKINNAYAFTNTFGYVTNYDVWISNTPQFSPITLFQIN